MRKDEFLRFWTVISNHPDHFVLIDVYSVHRLFSPKIQIFDRNIYYSHIPMVRSETNSPTQPTWKLMLKSKFANEVIIIFMDCNDLLGESFFCWNFIFRIQRRERFAFPMCNNHHNSVFNHSTLCKWRCKEEILTSVCSNWPFTKCDDPCLVVDGKSFVFFFFAWIASFRFFFLFLFARVQHRVPVAHVSRQWRAKRSERKKYAKKNWNSSSFLILNSCGLCQILSWKCLRSFCILYCITCTAWWKRSYSQC